MAQACPRILLLVRWLIAPVLLLTACQPSGVQPERTQSDWRSLWAVEKGLSLEVDSRGFSSPTSIVFVPRPGSEPDDPLYFVTELAGTIKVVTNSRTVQEFARVELNLDDNIPMLYGIREVGLAGLCLDPIRGFVFATFAYRDAGGIIRNGMTRFATAPVTFSTRPIAERRMDDLFMAEVSAPSHQIGPCQVVGDAVFVSVGDGENPVVAQNLESSQGKILRMSVDGEPDSRNPFFLADSVNHVGSYIWAYGFRNPFGLLAVSDRLFVADNGAGIDRFLEVHRGRNYLWDGSDRSFGANALQVISPSNSPVQIAYVSATDSVLGAESAGSFVAAIAGNMHTPQALPREMPGLMRINYDLAADEVRAPPTFILRYVGESTQMVVGTARGPDGVYFVPLFPDSAQMTFVYKIRQDLAEGHPLVLDEHADAGELMVRYSCIGCHQMGGVGGSVGPSLDPGDLTRRILERVTTHDYESASVAMDADSLDSDIKFRLWRAAVREAEGVEKARTWIKYRLMEPRFDDRNARMPTLGLSEEQATTLAATLTDGVHTGLRADLRRIISARLPPASPRNMFLLFLLGGFLGATTVGVTALAARGLRRRSRAR